ncbi:TetR/AcrR family transcriptional regulator [Actibacterium ureilyticum]|uniref:TetR/AcrR family transcriptional regulator n=1 Tax=Actibacterium ureilyticum TaxID=1590614 RepID=UPI000BAB04DF|nr:TetR/AcrR family transcriptional regulator [Actibacterium ureilyticum]
MNINPDIPANRSPAAWSCIGQPADTPRDRILSAATELFCHNGFAATGVDTIAHHAGTAKSTLYAHFKSKDNLIEAVLEREGQAWRSWFFGQLNKTAGTPAQKIASVFDILELWFSDPEFYGCPFINAISESNSEDDRLRAAVASHKSHLNLWLHAQALEMGFSDPGALVRQMTVLIDGAIVAAQVSRDASFARVAKEIAARL